MSTTVFNYRPSGAEFGDTIPFFWKGRYHLFYLRAPIFGTVEQLDWAHIVSDDLVHWDELPLALVRGSPGEPDHDGIWTGSVTQKDGTFHAFYTGLDKDSPTPQTTCHATSDDLVHWWKDPGNPILRPDGRWYDLTGKVDYRDPFVLWNDEEQCYWMLTTARRNDTTWALRGCLALATSPDLVTWEQRGPLWKPDLTWVTECPDLFRADDRWTLLYTAGESFLRRARALPGPWIGLPLDTVDGTGLSAVKSLHDGRRRILLGYIRLRLGESDGGGRGYGGQLALPRELAFDPDGNARTWPVDEVVNAFQEEVYGVSQLQASTAAQTGWSVTENGLSADATAGACHLRLCEQPSTCLITCRMRLDDEAASAGLLLRMGEAGDSAPPPFGNSGYDGYTLMVEPARHRVVLRRWHNWSQELEPPWMERPLSVERGRWVSLQVFVRDSIIEAFFDRRIALSYRLYDRRSGWLGLLVKNGPGSITDLSVRVLPAV